MESSRVRLEIPSRNSQIDIRPKYQFTPNHLEITLNGDDLAHLLELTNKRNLQELHFQLEIEIVKTDGSTEEISIILPQEAMLANPETLRQMEAASSH